MVKVGIGTFVALAPKMGRLRLHDTAEIKLNISFVLSSPGKHEFEFTENRVQLLLIHRYSPSGRTIVLKKKYIKDIN